MLARSCFSIPHNLQVFREDSGSDWTHALTCTFRDSLNNRNTSASTTTRNLYLLPVLGVLPQVDF
jgi:hypothetical protein